MGKKNWGRLEGREVGVECRSVSGVWQWQWQRVGGKGSREMEKMGASHQKMGRKKTKRKKEMKRERRGKRGGGMGLCTWGMGERESMGAVVGKDENIHNYGYISTWILRIYR